MAEQYLDCKGQRCPRPILKLCQLAKGVPAGGRLKVEATDPAFRADVEAWARRMNFTVVQFADGPVQSVVLEKRG